MVTITGLPPIPALVVGEVIHSRRTPIRHALRHRAYQWLVDIDDLPKFPRWLRPLTRFRAADHLDGGRLGGGMRGDLTRFLGRRGVRLRPTDRVLMLANARVLGHVFDPLSVFWCLSESGTIRAIVFEVHNTYGERHAYLLRTDSAGRARTDKAFYVSPFNDRSGHYDVRLRLAHDRVDVTIGLMRDGQRIFTGISRGIPRPTTRGAVLRVTGTHLFMTQRISALIRLHGIWLWLRRLPVVPRVAHTEEGVR
ncbi:DUF1365 domain-containing protein [Cumulibacter soli]|uniref:DUF1365 domain-containing protein n=1 Tax=Cumulibacter soli TaxID=2546344 RepID=UPI001068D105|nr:DUF1365 domain-containing protein [Cumulibacter soli]